MTELPCSRSVETVCDLAPDPQWTELGLAEISSLDLFKCEGDHNLLDSGATVMLLGSALAGSVPGAALSKAFFEPVTRIPTLAASVHKFLIASDNCTPGAFWRPGSDGLSYTHLFREKNCAKHVAKYQLFQTAMP